MNGPQHYRFLVKPVFFIVSLLCAAYVVLKLEQLEPSDVGMEIPSYHTAPPNNLKITDTLKKTEEIEKATIGE